MLPHQTRVIEERQQLDIKIAALMNFINTSEVFKQLDTPDQQLLEEQLDVMQVYSTLLSLRIARFKS
jgi:hypothetical protein